MDSLPFIADLNEDSKLRKHSFSDVDPAASTSWRRPPHLGAPTGRSLRKAATERARAQLNIMARCATVVALSWWLATATGFQLRPARRAPAAVPLRSAAGPDDDFLGGAAPPLGDLKADIARFRGESGEIVAAAADVPAAPDVSAFDGGRGDADAALLADVDRFRRTQVAPVGGERGPMQSLIGTLGTILSVNFVVIFVLFLWFLSGVFNLYALDNETVILAVKAAFDPFILPLLSTHMGLTFLSFGLEKTFGEGDPEDDGGFRL